jgi:CheY-like chemotaxis protein/predicted transcriptional regulator
MSIEDIHNAISDGRTVSLLKIIASERVYTSTLMNKTKLSRKQYYSRMSRLIKVGLVKKNKGKYFLTSLGKAIYDSQLRIENAIDNYWKLKAVDSFEIYNNGISKEEYKKLVDNLIDDHQIKDILIENKYPHSSKMASVSEKSVVTHRQEREESSPKIMLVEDEPDTLLTYKTFLAAEGYDVETFTDPYEALNRFIKMNQHYYDLIITDIRMPGMNGLQLYQKLNAIDNSVKILFVSALDAAEELISILVDVSSTDVIKKPINKEDFVNTVKKALY